MEDIKQYIESGVLELYVLGDLTQDEMFEVERMASTYPEIQQELNEIAEGLENYAFENAIEPSGSLKASVLGQLEFSTVEVKPEIYDNASKEHKIIPLKVAQSSSFYKYAFAASIALLAVSVFALVKTYNDLKKSQQQLVSLTLQNQSFANRVNFQENQLNGYRQRLGEPVSKNPVVADTTSVFSNSPELMALKQQSQADSAKLNAKQAELNDVKNTLAALKNQNKRRKKELSILSDPDSRFIKLKGMPFSPSSAMLVAWNPDKHQLWISKELSTLPKNDKDHQYQLWAIRKLKPISLGTFDIDDQDSIMEKMMSIDRASAFAVTLEPRGGSKKPTLSQMVVMGLAHK